MEVTIEEYRKAIKTVEAYRKQLRAKVVETQIQLNKIRQKNILESVPDPKTKIVDVGMSVRLWSILKFRCDFFNGKHFSDVIVKDLGLISKKEFLKIPQVGQKALVELVEITELAGVKLKD